MDENDFSRPCIIDHSVQSALTYVMHSGQKYRPRCRSFARSLLWRFGLLKFTRGADTTTIMRYFSAYHSAMIYHNNVYHNIILSVPRGGTGAACVISVNIFFRRRVFPPRVRRSLTRETHTCRGGPRIIYLSCLPPGTRSSGEETSGGGRVLHICSTSFRIYVYVFGWTDVCIRVTCRERNNNKKYIITF